jgi:hypothetical protein
MPSSFLRRQLGLQETEHVRCHGSIAQNLYILNGMQDREDAVNDVDSVRNWRRMSEFGRERRAHMEYGEPMADLKLVDKVN